MNISPLVSFVYYPNKLLYINRYSMKIYLTLHDIHGTPYATGIGELVKQPGEKVWTNPDRIMINWELKGSWSPTYVNLFLYEDLTFIGQIYIPSIGTIDQTYTLDFSPGGMKIPITSLVIPNKVDKAKKRSWLNWLESFIPKFP